MGSQTSLKTSQRGGCNPLNPPPGSASVMKIKTIKKRNTTRPGVKMKTKKVASHFADWSITEPHVTPHIYSSTNRIKCNKWTTNNREDLFIYSFIYLFNRFHHNYKTKKDLGGKNTFEQDTKMTDEGAGHTTERGSKLIVPLRKIHKY